ncbi:MAG TPA: hypothetical protein EYG80_00990 [Flavobacteriaceae bacterium]|nr:hypothetical protein [Flavobacteriaceae bacterium]
MSYPLCIFLDVHDFKRRKLMKYSELEEYYQEHESNMIEILKKIEMKIIKGRDKENIPIYMTRARVKSIESSYLKTKRKDKKEIMAITDLIGLRIVCLFEQDIIVIYRFLLDMFKRDVYELEEVLIFGWKKDSIVKKTYFAKELQKHEKYNNIQFRDEPRESGYQSIHFVGTYQDFDENIKYPFELQLRTLLQDAWGELEHQLAYKQKSSLPFIKNSFLRLSKSLEVNDMLITNLKESIDESSCGIDKIPFTIGNVLKYEKERLPQAFEDNILIKKQYEKYKSTIYKDGFLRMNKIEEAKEIYKELTTLYYQEQPDGHADYNFNYWKEMEQAFFDIYDENFSDAKRIYFKYLEKDSYVSAYRLGQIYLYEDKLTEALKKLDKCFEILDEKCLHINQMKLHVNMALIFWNLGGEYLTSTIKEIKEALVNIEMNIERYNLRDLETLYNSACWYYMECHFNERCTKKEAQANEEAIKYYNKLIELVTSFKEDNEFARKHTYDTLAWYNYRRFIESGKEELSFIQTAYSYIILMNDGIMPVTQYYSHEGIQQSHLQKIKCEYQRTLKHGKSKLNSI